MEELNKWCTFCEKPLSPRVELCMFWSQPAPSPCCRPPGAPHQSDGALRQLPVGLLLRPELHAAAVQEGPAGRGAGGKAGTQERWAFCLLPQWANVSCCDWFQFLGDRHLTISHVNYKLEEVKHEWFFLSSENTLMTGFHSSVRLIRWCCLKFQLLFPSVMVMVESIKSQKVWMSQFFSSCLVFYQWYQ